MIKLIFRCSQLVKSDTVSYQSLKQLKLTLGESLSLMDRLSTERGKESQLLTLLTFVRKMHNRAFLKSRQELLLQIMDNCNGQMLPGIIANIEYTHDPEVYLPKACTLLVEQQFQMSIKAISNCVYSLGKIARRTIQSQNQQNTMIAYNFVLSTMHSLKDNIKLQTIAVKDTLLLTEILIGYQKMELFDLHDHLLEQISQCELKKFNRIESQLLHTLAKSKPEHPLVQKLFDIFLKEKHITLNSMVLALQAGYPMITEEILFNYMDKYVKLKDEANIQDLSMMTNIVFRKGLISKAFSATLTDSYEALRENVDINALNLMIPNMSVLINARKLDKKFINMFLISVKILNDNRKINRKFAQAFIAEMMRIEEVSIREKFHSIRFK